uniref:TPR_REGION domain-containing protein n=1 Tax=Strongyloides papillosus TaxID=174720 RepID=A0A0N5BQN8_STREA
MSNNFLTAHPFLSIAVATFGFGAIQVAFVYFIVEKDNKKRHSELLHEISYLKYIQVILVHFRLRSVFKFPSKMDFTTIDNQLENNENLAAYNALKALYDESTENKSNIELLWRLCRACYQRGSEFAAKDSKRKELMFEGKKYGEDAVKIDDKNLNVLKWAAACTGDSTNYMGTKEKIETGNYFKELLDKALAIDDSEYTLLYMRGRFCYSVASLSWIERKAASAFYATPPSATYEDALLDFLKVEEIKKGEWLENLLYIGRCYYQINDKSSSLKYLKMALECPNSKGEAEKDMLNEVQALIKKCSK